MWSLPCVSPMLLLATNIYMNHRRCSLCLTEQVIAKLPYINLREIREQLKAEYQAHDQQTRAAEIHKWERNIALSLQPIWAESGHQEQIHRNTVQGYTQSKRIRCFRGIWIVWNFLGDLLRGMSHESGLIRPRELFNSAMCSQKLFYNMGVKANS